LASIDWWLLVAAWLANPAIWIALIFFVDECWRMARVTAGCGLALGLAVLPRYYLVVGFLPGYWFWLGSAALILTASSIVSRKYDVMVPTHQAMPATLR